MSRSTPLQDNRDLLNAVAHQLLKRGALSATDLKALIVGRWKEMLNEQNNTDSVPDQTSTAESPKADIIVAGDVNSTDTAQVLNDVIVIDPQ